MLFARPLCMIEQHPACEAVTEGVATRLMTVVAAQLALSVIAPQPGGLLARDHQSETNIATEKHE